MTFNNVVDVQLLTNARLFVIPWLQHARHPCPSPSPGVCSNSCPLRWWCYPTISSSAAPFSFCLQSSPASVSFPMSQFFCIRWPKSFSFSIISSNEYSRLMSFSIDWFAVQAPQAPQFESINSLALSLLYGSTLFESLNMTPGKTKALTIWAFVGKEMSLFFNLLSRFVHYRTS